MKNKLHIPTLEQIRALNGLRGSAGGYLTRSDTAVPVGGQTIDGQSFSSIWTELQQRNAIYNRHTNFIVGLFASRVSQPQIRTAVPTTATFGEASEFGRPNKVRFASIFRGFPLRHYDLGYGYTQEYLDDVEDPGEIEGIQSSAENAWSALQYETVLNALMGVANRTSEDGVSVKALYNNDGEIPPAYQRVTHAGTHTHYLTTGGAAVTAASLLAAENHLLHHGYGDMVGGTGGTIIHAFNVAEMATVRALTGYIPAASGSVPQIVDGVVIGTRRGNIPMGLMVEGYFSKAVIVEENMLPAGYFVSWVSGGVFNVSNPVGLREHRNPSARGMRLIEGARKEYPLIDSVYDGYTGAGIRHRGAAVSTQVTAGAYASPTI